MGLCSYAGLLRFLSSNDVSETRKLGERSQQRELLAAELRGMDPLAARLRERAAAVRRLTLLRRRFDIIVT